MGVLDMRVDNDYMQLERVATRDESKFCETCNELLPKGTQKFKWRMRMANNRFYHNGSFWCTQCPNCFGKIVDEWQNELLFARDLIE